MSVVGCPLSRMRSKFRKLHVENPLFKTEDGVPVSNRWAPRMLGVVAAQAWHKRVEENS